jgi:hypothetical protein
MPIRIKSSTDAPDPRSGSINTGLGDVTASMSGEHTSPSQIFTGAIQRALNPIVSRMGDDTRNVSHTLTFETGFMVDDRFWPAPDSAGNKCFNEPGAQNSIISMPKGNPAVITCATWGGWLQDADGEDSPDGVILGGFSGEYSYLNGMMVRTRNVVNGGLTFSAYYDHSGMLTTDTSPYGYMVDGEGLETSVDDMGANPLDTTGLALNYTPGIHGSGYVEGIFRRIEQLDEVSTTSSTDQKVIQISGTVGGDAGVIPRTGTHFLRDTVHYNKPYDINGRVSTGDLKGGNSGHNKPRSQITMPGETDVLSDLKGWAAASIYIPSDYADENGVTSGDSRNTFFTFGPDGGSAGLGNFSIGNPGGDIPTTDIFGNSTPSGAGNVWVWRERYNPVGFTASNNLGQVWWHNLGAIDEDRGLWVDFVFEWVWNPMDTTAAPSTIDPAGSTRVHQANNGMFRVWKSTGPYIDGNQNRLMRMIYDHDAHPDHPFRTGTLPSSGNEEMDFGCRQYRFGWHRNPTTTRDPVSIGWDCIRMGAEVRDGTQYEDVHPTGQEIPKKKWNPGHYIKTQGNPTDTDTAGYWAGVQSTITSRMSDIPEILGAFVAISPGMVNPSPGVYDWDDVDATLAQIKAAGNRRMILDLTWKSFNDGTPGLHAPPDLSGEIEPAGTGWIWAVWRQSNMDRLITIYQAMADRYDSDPNIELITSAETAPSFSGMQPGDYSVAAYIVQLKRLYTANSAAFVETMWAPNMNSLGGDDMDELYEHMFQTSAAVAFPDWGKGRAAQLFDGRNTSTEVDREFRGQIAAHGIVSTNKLNDSGVTPSSIFTEQLTHQATHFSWITSASGEDSWTNIKAAIQANEPGGAVTACPTRWGGCK